MAQAYCSKKICYYLLLMAKGPEESISEASEKCGPRRRRTLAAQVLRRYTADCLRRGSAIQKKENFLMLKRKTLSFHR